MRNTAMRWRVAIRQGVHLGLTRPHRIEWATRHRAAVDVPPDGANDDGGARHAVSPMPRARMRQMPTTGRLCDALIPVRALASRVTITKTYLYIKVY